MKDLKLFLLLPDRNVWWLIPYNQSECFTSLRWGGLLFMWKLIFILYFWDYVSRHYITLMKAADWLQAQNCKHCLINSSWINHSLCVASILWDITNKQRRLEWPRPSAHFSHAEQKERFETVQDCWKPSGCCARLALCLKLYLRLRFHSSWMELLWQKRDDVSFFPTCSWEGPWSSVRAARLWRECLDSLRSTDASQLRADGNVSHQHSCFFTHFKAFCSFIILHNQE